MLFFILLVFLFSTQNSAQSGTFHLGMKVEFYGYTSKEVRNYNAYSKKFNLSPLPSVYVVASKDLSEFYSISLKPGIIFKPDNFGTFEIGLLGCYEIPDSKYFITSGVNTHFNKEPDERQDIPGILYFIVVGGGYRLTNHLSADLSFHQALNKTYNYTYAKFLSDVSGSSELFNMVKIGFTAAF